ncbi:hypothetical protein CBM2595_A80032 [Cupriavidus taiwanensis]|nr:hypothetical protein CBM2595_A80032 [Cupriavidus taiwanensis]
MRAHSRERLHKPAQEPVGQMHAYFHDEHHQRGPDFVWDGEEPHTHNAAVGTGWPSGQLVGSNAIAFSAAGGVGWCRAGRGMGRIDNLFAELTGM